MAENQADQGHGGDKPQGSAHSGSAPDIQPSEPQTENSEHPSGDPGRTPGKAEGEDDSSATDGGADGGNG